MIIRRLSMIFLAMVCGGLAKETQTRGKPTEEFKTRKITRTLLENLEGVTLDVPKTEPDLGTMRTNANLRKNKTPPRQQKQGASARIVGGDVANPKRYPYYCWIAIYDVFDNIMSSCGCSLIHTDMALSAAHCYVDKMAEIGNVAVFVNTTRNPFRYEATGYEQGAWMQDAWWPAGYLGAAGGSINYDFLIIKLDRSIDGITPVTMNPSVSFPTSGDDVTVFGFGFTETGGGMPDFLEEVDVEVKTSFFCGSKFPSLYDNTVTLCAGESGQGSCNGDSGGPLIIPGGSASSDVQVGIVSYGSVAGCADVSPDSPTVYSRVSWWYDTIVSVICTESDFSSSMCSGGGSCATSPVDWVDSYGDDCEWYVTNGCSSANSYENQGKTANEACCFCGGGSVGVSEPVALTWNGWGGCSPSSPCGKCEGDCDLDVDCAGSLRCYTRDGFTSIPGCTGSGKSHGDYCYE